MPWKAENKAPKERKISRDFVNLKTCGGGVCPKQ
jgi:hypothetical protein